MFSYNCFYHWAITNAMLFLLAFQVVVYLHANTIHGSRFADLEISVQYKPDDCEVVSELGDELFVHYNGFLENGKMFDSSLHRGNTNPVKFTIGRKQVIEGWEKGLLDMCVGEKRRLIIPPEMGYGEDGYLPEIPPRSTLIFETTLVDVQKSSEHYPDAEFILRFLRLGLPPLAVVYGFYYLYKKYQAEMNQQRELKKQHSMTSMGRGVSRKASKKGR